jgi:hypothetical protein
MLNVDNAIAIYLIVFLMAMLAVCAIGWIKNYKGTTVEEMPIPPAPPENE